MTILTAQQGSVTDSQSSYQELSINQTSSVPPSSRGQCGNSNPDHESMPQSSPPPLQPEVPSYRESLAMHTPDRDDDIFVVFQYEPEYRSNEQQGVDQEDVERHVKVIINKTRPTTNTITTASQRPANATHQRPERLLFGVLPRYACYNSQGRGYPTLNLLLWAMFIYFALFAIKELKEFSIEMAHQENQTLSVGNSSPLPSLPAPIIQNSDT